MAMAETGSPTTGGQHEHRVRCEWGPYGGRAVAAGADVAVVVDVLSFTTSLTIAIERGIEVIPSRWTGPEAAQLARSYDAVLAVGRGDAGARTDVPTLSPATMLQLTAVPGRLVLPSPNGSTVCRELRDAGAQVVGGCLRNAEAVAERLAPVVAGGGVVAVVPAGERWPDGSLRPAAEDLWGAGAVLSTLLSRVPTAGLSPEARVAVAAFEAVRGDLEAALLSCASGLELIEKGYAEDVTVAARLDASPVVPVLVGAMFGSAGHEPH